MTTIATLKDRHTDVQERIARACDRAGRKPEYVALVAVTKTADPDQIRELIRLGHIDFGENRVQHLVQRAAIIDEWLGRHRALPGTARPRQAGEDLWFDPLHQAGAASAPSPSTKVRWHMIGHLQRNKARKVVETCRLVHSLDSLRLAEELQAIAHKRDQPVEVLIQVNCTGEPQKYGCAIAAAPHLADQIETMVHVRLRGLMTMAAHTTEPDASRATFARCRELFEEMKESRCTGPEFNILSMGMSGDFEAAILEGSNLIRVGTALFGEAKPGMDGTDDDEDGGSDGD